MYNIKNNYFHKTKLKIKCECCTNEFIDIKELFTKEKMSKKNIEEYYDNYYTSKKMEICNKCHSDMFPEEYINIKSYTIKDYNSDLVLKWLKVLLNKNVINDEVIKEIVGDK